MCLKEKGTTVIKFNVQIKHKIIENKTDLRTIKNKPKYAMGPFVSGVINSGIFW